MEAYQKGAFWHSKISDARKCLRYYKLKHIDGLKVEEEKSADLEFGSAMHLGLNGILTGDGGADLFTIYWDSVKDTGLAYGRCDWAQLKEIGEVLLARFERLHAKHFEMFKAEERIFAKIGDFAFEGTPDFLGKYKGVPSVVDFKTAGYRYDKLKIISDEQMRFYAYLAKKHYDYHPQQLVYAVFIKDPKAPSIQVVTSELTDSILCTTIENVTDTCEDLVERRKFPMNTSNCIMGTRVCPYFQSCFGVKE